jgi:hypothetical protein
LCITLRGRCSSRPRCRWVDNIKVDLAEIGWGGTDWTGLAQDTDKLEGFCEYGNERSGTMKCCEILKQSHNSCLLKKSSSP